MKIAAVKTQGATGNTSREIKISEEGLNVKVQTGKAKLFPGLVLGVAVVAGAALYFGATTGGDEGRAGVGGQAEGSFLASEQPKEVGSAYQVPYDDELAELYYDDLTSGLFGITSAVPAPAPEFRIDPEWDRANLREELIRAYEAMGIPWAFDERWNVVEVLPQPVAGIPLSRAQMEARIEQERLEDPDLDGMLFDMLLGPPAGGDALGGQVAVHAVYEEFDAAEWPHDEQLTKDFFGIPLTTK